MFTSNAHTARTLAFALVAMTGTFMTGCKSDTVVGPAEVVDVVETVDLGSWVEGGAFVRSGEAGSISGGRVMMVRSVDDYNNNTPYRNGRLNGTDYEGTFRISVDPNTTFFVIAYKRQGDGTFLWGILTDLEGQYRQVSVRSGETMRLPSIPVARYREAEIERIINEAVLDETRR